MTRTLIYGLTPPEFARVAASARRFEAYRQTLPPPKRRPRLPPSCCSVEQLPERVILPPRRSCGVCGNVWWPLHRDGLRFSPEGRTRRSSHYDQWSAKAWHDAVWGVPTVADGICRIDREPAHSYRPAPAPVPETPATRAMRAPFDIDDRRKTGTGREYNLVRHGGWPLLDLHARLAELALPQESWRSVQLARTRATDVPPFPAGVRGRLEAWSVAVDMAAQPVRATERKSWQRWRGPDDSDASREVAHVLDAGLYIGLPDAEPDKEPRVCERPGCGEVIPASARADKATCSGACRKAMVSLRRQAA